MKRLLLFALILASSSAAWAKSRNPYSYDNRRPYKDTWGNSYKHESNLNKDTDGDGVLNRYDYNDRNARIQYKGQKDPYDLFGN